MKKAAIVIVILGFYGCIKSYTPNVHSPVTGYLVVEGNINTAPTTTTITLSRTEPLTDTASQLFENGATIAVEGSDGSIYNGAQAGSGQYSFGAIPLDSTKTYRLDITTADGTRFMSEFVKVIPTPPIDSIYPSYDGSGAHILVDAHNPQNNTRCYMWNWSETWEFHAAEYSYYEYNGSAVVIRPPADEVYTCWRNDVSTSVLIYSSAKLSEDVVSRFQLTLIPEGDQRLSVEYSILVNQWGLSDSAYDYFQLMQTNTENLGSIFDPLPSSLKGNIYCVSDPSQPVVGYVNASSIQTLRVFIQRPINWPYLFECGQKDTTLPADKDLARNFAGGNGAAYTPLTSTTPPGEGWVSNLSTCTNCITMGGTNVKPAFWP